MSVVTANIPNAAAACIGNMLFGWRDHFITAYKEVEKAMTNTLKNTLHIQRNRLNFEGST